MNMRKVSPDHSSRQKQADVLSWVKRVTQAALLGVIC
jgi:hypothetical protein